MYSVCVMKHLLERGLIVINILDEPLLGELWLGQGLDISLLEVVGVGLITCGEEELVRQVHTLFGRDAQVVYELQVQEEMEGVRQEVREVEGESKARRNAHMFMFMWME